MKRLLSFNRGWSVTLSLVLLFAATIDRATPNNGATTAPNPQTSNRGPEIEVEGVYLLAFASVVKYIDEDMPTLPSPQKDLNRYSILFYTTEHYYHIEFVPHKLPSEKNLLGCYYQLGRAMDFMVTKSNFRVVGVRPCFG